MKNIIKLAAALAVIAAVVFAIVKYADELKKLLDRCSCCKSTEAETPAVEAPAAPEAPAAQETPAEEAAPAEETPAEEAPAVEPDPSEVTPEDFAD